MAAILKPLLLLSGFSEMGGVVVNDGFRREMPDFNYFRSQWWQINTRIHPHKSLSNFFFSFHIFLCRTVENITLHSYIHYCLFLIYASHLGDLVHNQIQNYGLQNKQDKQVTTSTMCNSMCTLTCMQNIQVYEHYEHRDCFRLQLSVKNFVITLQGCVVTFEAQMTNHLITLQRKSWFVLLFVKGLIRPPDWTHWVLRCHLTFGCK